MIQPEQLELLSGKTGILLEKENGRKMALERQGDVWMEAKLGNCHVIFAEEIQAETHYAMPMRSMLYEVLEYTKQGKNLEKCHCDTGDKLEGGALLSGITEKDRFKPVVLTILFLGDHWDGSYTLREMMAIDEEEEFVQYIRKYLTEYKLNIVFARKIECPEKFQTCLQHIFNMLKYNSDKKHLYQYIQAHRLELDKMDSVETEALFVLLNEQKRVEELLKRRGESESINMCRAIDELIQDGVERGIGQGIEQGIEQTERRMEQMVDFLLKDDCAYLIPDAIKNRELRDSLYRKYNIM